MARRKPAAADWRNREIDDWNTTTFRHYIGHIHESQWGIPYLPFGTWKMEMAKIKQAIDAYGAATVKAFVDEIAAHWRPTQRYPGFNFGFIITYRQQELQRVIRRGVLDTAHTEKSVDIADVDDGEEIEW